ncbi:NAD kinase [Paralimibaculum aggregatum]|uniref:NAD kinase n=1 Tax=Paralimibaculum aggregatum TaxID=3036245 RepID=A0ABQ6LHF4_9RHOB|nr:NAD kinase [Limibaculum sp. NKW23]GMG81665.1 NAD kinase [Limibaculum sp. NKW23]
MAFEKISFQASEAEEAQTARDRLAARYGSVPLYEAEVIVALGGDGFMLQTLHLTMGSGIPVYGMNRGTVGFLMNDYSAKRLPERLARASRVLINPLRMRARDAAGTETVALAINEVSLLRETRQAAKIRISVNDEVMLEELIGDGVMVATPAGSTAYNFSAHGPILPIKAKLLALTAVAPFRPRRWRGALLYYDNTIRFDVLSPEKRPISATADATEVRHVVQVEIGTASEIEMTLLYDPGHGLEERIIREQFLS